MAKLQKNKEAMVDDYMEHRVARGTGISSGMQVIHER
jgi:hypothetical protein